MLQQTQVSRVTEYFPASWPVSRRSARSRGHDPRPSWRHGGLGYYARAKNLPQTGEGAVGTGYRLPDDPDELIKLRRGRYTAGAVACFATRSRAAVDVNVARVLNRVFNERGAGAGSRELWALAGSLVPRTASALGASIRPSWSWGAGVHGQKRSAQVSLRRGCALYLRSKDRSRHQR